ncbi:hypothetical protein RCH18_000558 [Flavobacterium sp. PL11]|uniref:hypothetical protein n=1 Tax=Flavobacterium sp. PL11 TaxID=3071717 RepID=UPI002DFC68C4|nr:hypothetical protein [Flavobacterium sp. PL11]
MKDLKQQIIDKVASSLNYYNVSDDDLAEMMEDIDLSDMNEILDAIITLNTLLFQCEL